MNYVDEIPRSLTDATSIKNAHALLKTAKKPLIIVGKGIAYGDAHLEMQEFVERVNMPFLSTPMGKGVITDDHPLYIGPARSLALKEADVIFLCGARLNWILHFGKPPRFLKDVKIIQLENDPHEISQNLKSEVVLFGDAKAILGQMNDYHESGSWSYESDTPWWGDLKTKIDKNQKLNDFMGQAPEPGKPLNYYNSIGAVERHIPKDCMLIGEGANTMDIGRTILKNHFPKQRLDAATFGTMGIGFPAAIAAAAVHPEKRVVMVMGDSAFGFSAMELETAARYKMNLVCVIINNNGIYAGVDSIDQDGDPESIPVTALNPANKYELLSEAFGGIGLAVKTADELENALTQAFDTPDRMFVINVAINPSGEKKP